MLNDAADGEAMGSETEKRNILNEIERVRLEIDDKENGTTSLRMDELKLQLIRLYKRYTDLVNAGG